MRPVSPRSLPAALPRAGKFETFAEEPFEFLQQARARHGDLFVLRERGPLFSRDPDCPGVVVALGAANQRAVLTDLGAFGMPESAAALLGLPPRLINLNRGLHGMRGRGHARQKRLLTGILSGTSLEDCGRGIEARLEELTRHWIRGRPFGLLTRLRELTLGLSSAILFGNSEEALPLSRLLHAYFNLRREASSPTNASDSERLESLIALGTELDNGLRQYIHACRRNDTSPGTGLIARLAGLRLDGRPAFPEDEVVGHSNVLFVSSVEPTAITMSWVLLVLSQLPELAGEVRRELNERIERSAASRDSEAGRITRLDCVLNECLRLLPPNAFMVRIAREAVALGGSTLPAGSEVVLCPFVAHRDGAVFPRPDEFLPERWREAAPSAFEYFPFGAGGHSCVGRGLALHLIQSVLAFLLKRHELVLAGDQELDWRLHIIFMPRTDPLVMLRRPGNRSAGPGGRLGGTVWRLAGLPGDHS